jgi:deoxyribodipyrimidine photolyase
VTTRTIVWFRGKDLRISDHAPLRDALAAGDVIPLFVLDPYFFAPNRARELPHRMQFLLDSLRALDSSLAERGSRLIVVAGKSVEVVPDMGQFHPFSVST